MVHYLLRLLGNPAPGIVFLYLETHPMTSDIGVEIAVLWNLLGKIVNLWQTINGAPYGRLRTRIFPLEILH